MKIVDVDAYQILDSRGNPTLEAEVALEDGSIGHGLVPSGASTGQFEALELRDGDLRRFRGKSVERAVRHVQGEIAARLRHENAYDQAAIDQALIALDGTVDKSRLGANAILGASMAVANAAARSRSVPLFEHLGNGVGKLIPLPEIQIIGGGAHASWQTDIQDYLVVPTGATSFWEALEMSYNVYHAIGDLLTNAGKRCGVADEGGYWPQFERNCEPLELIVRAIEMAGYAPGTEVAISLDIAASDLYDAATGLYSLRLEGRHFSSHEFAELICGWIDEYPIVSVEDPMSDIDVDGWKEISRRLTHRLLLVGDDFFVTNIKRISEGIGSSLANAVLIKLNQIGTVTETIQAIRTTQHAGWVPIISARSGETEDAFISHLAVATNAGMLKVGSIVRGERTAKWNELLRIERQLGKASRYEGAKILHQFPGQPDGSRRTSV